MSRLTTCLRRHARGSVRRVSGAAGVVLAGGVVWRPPYDVQADKVWVAYVGKDGDVLRPACGRQYGSAGNEVVDAGSCPAPEQDSFAERLMNCPQDDGNPPLAKSRSLPRRSRRVLGAP